MTAKLKELHQEMDNYCRLHGLYGSQEDRLDRVRDCANHFWHLRGRLESEELVKLREENQNLRSQLTSDEGEEHD